MQSTVYAPGSRGRRSSAFLFNERPIPGEILIGCTELIQDIFRGSRHLPGAARIFDTRLRRQKGLEMESDKFDHISRSLAIRADRRQALRAAGTGGVFAAVAGAFGFSARGASATALAGPVDCTMPLLAKVALGKNKGKRYNGDLAITIETNGAIDSGRLTTSGGETFDVVGQASGRSLNLRIKIANDQFLSLIGTGQQEIALCRGPVDGTFGGWAESDMGTWSLGVKAAAKPAATSPATIAAGSGGGSNTSGSSGSGGSSGGGSSSGSSGGGGAAPTQTPCPPQDCGGGAFVWLPDLCACGCRPPTQQCGSSTCCPGGAICDSGSGNCSCPSGTEFCTDSCVPVCEPGSNRNYETCTCETKTSCGAGETLCNGACVSLSCNANQLFDATSCMCVNRCPSGQDFCGGNCISISTNDNCGSCGNVCPAGKSCYGTYCDCPPDYTYDASLGMCFPPCSVACTNGTTCVNGVCK